MGNVGYNFKMEEGMLGKLSSHYTTGIKLSFLIGTLMAISIFLLDISLPLGFAGGMPYILVILFGWLKQQRALILFMATLSTILTVLGYFYSPEGGVEWVVLANRLMAILGVWVLALFMTYSLKTASRLRKSENSLAEAQRMTRLGNWDLDLINNQGVWSDEVYRIFGLEKDEVGTSYDDFLEVVHPDDRGLVSSAYIDSIRNKTPHNLVHRLLLKDGTIKYVHATCETFYDPDGSSLRSIGTIQDITERTRLEEKIEQLAGRSPES